MILSVAGMKGASGRRFAAATSSRRGRGLEQPLHDHAVSPLPFELAVTLIDSDHPEPAPLVKLQARGVLREDARHDLPEPALGIGAAEGLQRGAPRPAA